MNYGLEESFCLFYVEQKYVFFYLRLEIPGHFTKIRPNKAKNKHNRSHTILNKQNKQESSIKNNSGLKTENGKRLTRAKVLLVVYSKVTQKCTLKLVE